MPISRVTECHLISASGLPLVRFCDCAPAFAPLSLSRTARIMGSLAEVSRMLHVFPQTGLRQRALNSVFAALPLFCAAALASPAMAQTAGPKEDTVYNRPVYVFSNDKLEFAIVKKGGSMLRV